MANMVGYDKIQNMYIYAEYIGKQDDFVSFLRYCAERLQHGAPVEEIWNDWRSQNNATDSNHGGSLQLEPTIIPRV